MWLLRAKACKLERFDAGKSIPEYAILSHTWNRQEISFEDLNAYHDIREDDFELEGHQGIRKLLGFCGIAIARGVEYV